MNEPISPELTGPLHITANRTTPKQTIRAPNPTDEGAIVIDRDGVILDLGGSELIGAAPKTPPNEYVGRGIIVRNARNVTIRNANIHGFKVAIYAENAPRLTIDHCDVSRNYRQRLKSTPLREHLDDWLYGHENDDNEWLRYGAGIYLLRCDGATLTHCRARNGQNGICLVRTNNAHVSRNDMSFMSGWGLAMCRCDSCLVIANRFDYCVRGYSHGVYARGQDSAGILVYEQCSDNLFAHNSATHGGDGFFLYAGNETVKDTGNGGCNRNLVFGNDFSQAVANAIEATFSADNLFIDNRLNYSTHGVWGGYSRGTRIALNEIADCDNGVSIEHGIANHILANRIENCRTGVHLWWDDDTDLLASAYGRLRGGASADESIRANRFNNCVTAVRVTDSRAVGIVGNEFDGSQRVLALRGDNSAAKFSANVVRHGRIENDGPVALQGAENFLAPGVTSAGLVELSSPATDGTALSASAKAWREALGDGLLWDWAPRLAQAPRVLDAIAHLPELPQLPSPLPGIPAGKEFILIDEWGPYDFQSPRVFPRSLTAWNEALIHVLGNGESFKVINVTGDVDVTPRSGTTPHALNIHTTHDASGAAPYHVEIDLAGQTLQARGVLLNATWHTEFYVWTNDNDPRTGDAAWQRIISAEPNRTETTSKLDFVWGGGAPEGLPSRDHFAAIATTVIELPAGRWRIRSISDDGIRVYVDDRRLIDNWTWHGPTEDTVEFESTGAPQTIRVEYFEIDGHSWLQLFLEPIGQK